MRSYPYLRSLIRSGTEDEAAVALRSLLESSQKDAVPLLLDGIDRFSPSDTSIGLGALFALGRILEYDVHAALSGKPEALQDWLTSIKQKYEAADVTADGK